MVLISQHKTDLSDAHCLLYDTMRCKHKDGVVFSRFDMLHIYNNYARRGVSSTLTDSQNNNNAWTWFKNALAILFLKGYLKVAFK